ncbi:MAG: magnesium transporter CorA family protein [Chloroflexi bacterium]|nr:magnesium transporter CorA family protein [Chloroflexota bacterium]
MLLARSCAKIEGNQTEDRAVAIFPARKEEQLNLESITWDDLTWTNIVGPTKREIDYLAKNYPFHPLDLDDCLSRIQRPKLDEYKEYLFVVLHFQVYNKETRVSTPAQLSLFIGDKYLITLHGGQLKPLQKLFQECQENEETRQASFSQGSGYLLYRIIDRLVDSYFPILDRILSMMEEVEDKVFDENVEAATEVGILRRDIITQRRIIWPMRSVLSSLETRLRRFTRMDISVYFGDLMDHINKITETLDEAKEVIEVYKDADFVLGTERINRIIRVLTVLSAITLPFIAISSLYGMNIPLPGGVERGSPRSLLILLALMLALSGSMLLLFRRRRWI